MAGRALGSMVGQGDLGALAGEGLSKLFGWGDYRSTIKGNSLMAGVSGNAVPKFVGDGKRGIRITEREFIGNVKSGALSGGSTVFSNQQYPLNPTSTASFPWLSKIARLFDQWEPHGIVFEFHTTSSTFNGTSQALGAIIMATDYDSYDPIYPNKQVMENADYACSSVPSSNLLHGVECDPRERPLPILYTTDRTNQTNFSNLGNFQIASQGCSVADVTLGELWVSYDITFYKKQLEDDYDASLSITGTSSAGGPLFALTNVLSQTDISYLPIVGTGVDIIFPIGQTFGRYEIIQQFTTLVAATVTTPLSYTNCATVSNTISVATVGQRFTRIETVDIQAANAKIRYGLSLGVTDTNYSVTAVPAAFNAAT
jgi:hypothetical protein